MPDGGWDQKQSVPRCSDNKMQPKKDIRQKQSSSHILNLQPFLF